MEDILETEIQQQQPTDLRVALLVQCMLCVFRCGACTHVDISLYVCVYAHLCKIIASIIYIMSRAVDVEKDFCCLRKL